MLVEIKIVYRARIRKPNARGMVRSLKSFNDGLVYPVPYELILIEAKANILIRAGTAKLKCAESLPSEVIGMGIRSSFPSA